MAGPKQTQHEKERKKINHEGEDLTRRKKKDLIALFTVI